MGGITIRVIYIRKRNHICLSKELFTQYNIAHRDVNIYKIENITIFGYLFQSILNKKVIVHPRGYTGFGHGVGFGSYAPSIIIVEGNKTAYCCRWHLESGW